MHITFFAFATLIALSSAARVGQVSLGADNAITETGCGKGGNQEIESTGVCYERVDLPVRHVILGPPKFPKNVIDQDTRPYCDYNISLINDLCSGWCGSTSPSCFSFVASID